MTMTPLFQHRHYKRIATIIAMCPDEETRAGMARLFGHGLQGSNPNYDRSRFEAAAMRKPINGRDNPRNGR
jgi:hypothetical protein